jgi:hypothetical protein
MYHRDRQEGFERHWDERGRLREESHYHLDQIHGLWRKWDEHGNEEIIGDFLYGNERQNYEKWPPRKHSNYERVFPFWRWEPEQFRAEWNTVASALTLPTWRLVADPNRPFRDETGACYFNYANLGRVDEDWPSHEGVPLVPLVQLDCRGLAPLPHFLEGTEFLTMFARPDPQCREDVVIRTYGPGEPLRPLTPPPTAILQQPAFIAISPAEASYPDHNDLPPGLKALLEDEWPDSPLIQPQSNRFDSRIGGWPGWLQESGVYTYGELMLQLDRLDVPTLRGGDSAVHYFFRDEAVWTWASESLSPAYHPSGPR